jgi:hypothetical protein
MLAVVQGHQLSELVPGKSLFAAVRAVPPAKMAEAFGDALFLSINGD